jgi:hypothetical protein
MKVNAMNNENINEPIPEYYNGFPIREIIKAVESVSYGYVQIIVQDHKIIQIDKTEKIRIKGQREVKCK